MESKIILETERLVLREFNFDDAPFIFKLVNTPSWLKFIGDKNVRTVQDAKNYLETGPIESYKENGFGLSAVVLKDDHCLIGMCGLVNRESLEDIDIGFALLPEYSGLGYGNEIASATVRHAKNVLGLKKIVAITDAKNISSIKLLNRIGLQFEKTVSLSINDSALLFSPKEPCENLAEIDQLTNNFFSLFTNKNGKKLNLGNIKSLFIDEGVIISNTGNNSLIYDVDSFIEPRERMLSDGTLTEFSESEISHTTNFFGNIAHRFLLYEKSGILNGQPFETRGMKTIQFVKIKGEWKISSVAWSDEEI